MFGISRPLKRHKGDDSECICGRCSGVARGRGCRSVARSGASACREPTGAHCRGFRCSWWIAERSGAGQRPPQGHSVCWRSLCAVAGGLSAGGRAQVISLVGAGRTRGARPKRFEPRSDHVWVWPALVGGALGAHGLVVVPCQIDWGVYGTAKSPRIGTLGTLVTGEKRRWPVASFCVN